MKSSPVFVPPKRPLIRILDDIYYDTYQFDTTETAMTTRAKLFITGRRQAVRLPLEYRFEGDEGYIRRDPITGDVVLSRPPDSWVDFFALHETTDVPADFMSEADRNQGQLGRDPFGGKAA